MKLLNIELSFPDKERLGTLAFQVIITVFMAVVLVGNGVLSTEVAQEFLVFTVGAQLAIAYGVSLRSGVNWISAFSVAWLFSMAMSALCTVLKRVFL